MIRLVGVFLCALVGVVAAPGGALAQNPNTPVASEASVTGEVAQAPVAERPIYSGIEVAQVGQVGQPPRTLRAYWHVFIAFAITWLLLFGYALSLGRRWAALERQLQQDLSRR